MKSMIKELWHGNIIPQEDSRNNSKEMKELLGYMARHHEDLEKTFNEEQKEIFEKFHNCWSEYMSLADGSRKKFNVYAKTREECEEALAKMIAEKKAEIVAEKAKMKTAQAPQRADRSTVSPQKMRCRRQRRSKTFMSLYLV